MGYITDDIVDTVNDLPYKRPECDKQNVNEKYVVRIAKTILTAFFKMLQMPCGADFFDVAEGKKW